MADLSYYHGVNLGESPDTPSLLRVTNFGVTFINGTAPDADSAAFPLNTPTLVTSLSQKQVESIEVIVDEAVKRGLSLRDRDHCLN